MPVMEKRHPLTAWREERGQSQNDLAMRLQVTRWTVNRIEVGGRKPSPDLAKRISRMTGIALSDLRPDIYEATQ
jgi:putative transcriptional regulator